jgi:hypothetical protein
LRKLPMNEGAATQHPRETETTMSTARRIDGELLRPAPRGVNTPGLLLGVIWLVSLAVGIFLYLNAPAIPTVGGNLAELGQSVSTFADAVKQRIWAYVFLGFGAIGLMIQLGAESVLWHLNRR